MKTGEYDGGAFSGDATLRLIAGGVVAAVNIDLIPNYANVFEGLKARAHNTVDGVAYGCLHGRGAERPDVATRKSSQPDLDSWNVVWDGGASMRARSRPTTTRLHRRRGRRPDGDQAELGIKYPYALDATQFEAAVDLLEAQRTNITHVLGRRRAQIDVFTKGDMVVGTTWQCQVNTLRRPRCRSRRPAEGRQHRLVRHLDGLVQGQEPQLHVHVDGPHHRPMANATPRSGSARRRSARRVVPKPRSKPRPLRHLPRDRRGVLQEGLVWNTPRRSASTGEADSARTSRSGPGLDRDRGLSRTILGPTPRAWRPLLRRCDRLVAPKPADARATAAGGPCIATRGSSSARSWPPRWLAVVAYLGALALLFVSAFWASTPFSGDIVTDAVARQLRDVLSSRSTGRSRSGRSALRPWSRDRYPPGVPDRLLHGPGRVPGVAGPPVSRSSCRFGRGISSRCTRGG